MEIKHHATKQQITHQRNQIKKKKKQLETNENRNTMYWNLWDAGKDVLRSIPQETRKISNNLILYLKKLKKRNKAQSHRRKEIIKIIAEINEIETKRGKVKKLRAGSLNK